MRVQKANHMIDVLDRLASIANRDEQEVFVWGHPRILEPGVAEGLEAEIRNRRRHERKPAERALSYVRSIRSRYETSTEGYPIGVGPIEQVWRRVSDGEIPQEDGARLVSEPAFLESLSPRYLRALSGFTLDSALTGGWPPALVLQMLVNTALDALPDEPALLSARVEAAVSWASIARAALVDAPDGRLLRDAESRGNDVLDLLRPNGAEQGRARILFGLGALFLDPYTATRTPTRFEESQRLWAARETSEDRFEDGSSTGASARMPEPIEALRTAEGYLRASAELAEGSYRGRVLKALAQALDWRALLGDQIDPDELRAVEEEALADLVDDEDLPVRMQLLVKRSLAGDHVDADELSPVLERTVDELERTFGTETAAGLVSTAIAILSPSEPRRALDLLRTSRSLRARMDDDSRIAAAQNELRLLIEVFAPEPPPNLSLEEEAQWVRESAETNAWGAVVKGCALLRTAVRAGTTDEEEYGLALLDEVMEVSPLLAGEHPEALGHFRAALSIGGAVNALNRRDARSCAEAYARALMEYVELGLATTALDTLHRIADVVQHSEAALSAEVVLALGPTAARAESLIGDAATEQIQTIVRDAVAAGAEHAHKAMALHYLWQVAKGARLAPVLAGGPRYTPYSDPHAQRLLDAVAAAEAELPGEAATATDDASVLLDEEMILNAYAQPHHAGSADTPQARLANLQGAYDEHITTSMLRWAAGATGSSAVTYEALAPALGARTVLLSMYLGASPDGRIAVYILSVAGDEVAVTTIPYDFPSSQVEVGGFRTSPFGLIVEQVRRGVQEPPLGRRVVTRETELDLENYLPGLLGHVSERLDDLLRTGRDHLCIVPHGPFHFFPFHLLTRAGRPLAEDFAVTYLPHLHLLVTGWNRLANPEPLAAFGLGFESDARAGLSPLPEAVPEARDIASVFGTQAVVDRHVTERAVVAGLIRSRYVHLSTHGRHNVHAPAFQCLYVSPEDGSDGRIFAHEVAALDLRGVRLVTLSACETALGRVDRGDNLRGLPASFFVAGVTTLIGTLWPVKDDVSRHFFVSLYEQIRARTPLLDAFTQAQGTTRSAYPLFGDWGAFYFAGDWADRGNDAMEVAA